MAADLNCPNCGARGLRIFHDAQAVPSNSCILLKSSEEAKAYPRGNIALGFCASCGFITNTAFEAKLTEYSDRYEETQGFSPTFSSFHKQLAQRLIDRFDLRDREVLEIGCGKGEFLMLLCELGGNKGVGFDPAYIPERNVSRAADRVTFIRDFYSEKYADTSADFVCCKMTLEHIHPTADFIGMVRRAIGDRPETVVFFQIPDATRIMQDCAFEDVYYEHCSYFSPCSLGRLFRDNGFEVLGMDTEYDEQYLTIEARPCLGEVPQPEDDEGLAELTEMVARFRPKYAEKTAWWRDRLSTMARDGRKVVLWGSGSKGVAFLSTLGLENEVAYAVDINPYRHGYYMPGSGLEIVSPEFLPESQPDVVIVMNAIYRREISEQLQSLGLQPEILTV